MSKFSLDVLREHVYPFTLTDDPDVLRGAAFGEDVALTKLGGDILASHIDPIVGAIEGIGSLAVNVACNDVAASGIQPRWILLLVMLPRKEEPEQLKVIMQDAQRAADEVGASIIGGHTGYSSGISRPLVAVTAMGNAGGRRVLGSAGANVGDHLLVSKSVGLEGTAILASDFADVALDLGLSADEIDRAKRLSVEVSVLPEALLLADQGATSMHDVTRGGLLESLLEISLLSQVGMEVQVDQIPVWPEVAQFAEAFGFDPLRMISSGTLVATISSERVEAAVRALDEIGVAAYDVGQVIDGEGVRLLSEDGEVREFLEPEPEVDELARLWQLYPRDG
jgi:hydrogenase expression/formation protein HypE